MLWEEKKVSIIGRLGRPYNIPDDYDLEGPTIFQTTTWKALQSSRLRLGRPYNLPDDYDLEGPTIFHVTMTWAVLQSSRGQRLRRFYNLPWDNDLGGSTIFSRILKTTY